MVIPRRLEEPLRRDEEINGTKDLEDKDKEEESRAAADRVLKKYEKAQVTE